MSDMRAIWPSIRPCSGCGSSGPFKASISRGGGPHYRRCKRCSTCEALQLMAYLGLEIRTDGLRSFLADQDITHNEAHVELIIESMAVRLTRVTKIETATVAS